MPRIGRSDALAPVSAQLQHGPGEELVSVSRQATDTHEAAAGEYG
ncbi:MAG: hypothetical protein ACRDSF_02520 [Pseudonocardiaceae bacterium]